MLFHPCPLIPLQCLTQNQRISECLIMNLIIYQTWVYVMFLSLHLPSELNVLVSSLLTSCCFLVCSLSTSLTSQVIFVFQPHDFKNMVEIYICVCIYVSYMCVYISYMYIFRDIYYISYMYIYSDIYSIYHICICIQIHILYICVCIAACIRDIYPFPVFPLNLELIYPTAYKTAPWNV